MIRRVATYGLLVLVALAASDRLALGQPDRDSDLPKPNLPAIPKKSLPVLETEFSRQELEWLRFRNAFPLHIQTLATSGVYPAGTRTLIVAEPPPHVTIEELCKVNASLLSNHSVKQWTIGFDGWVKDVVFELPPTGDNELNELIKKLSAYLFSTDYKAYALRLPVNLDELTTKYPLDIQVRTRDLETWYAKEAFVTAAGSDPRQLEGAPYGVYFSKEPGLVAWVIPKQHLEERKADARKFALDSDLVLGAVARDDKIAIFGRERVVPLTVLPPLRMEMVAAIAATRESSLSQSYERKVFAAGPAYGRWDWAPIYLSPELLDTEYGSILNMTDQMLKGWSEHGAQEYYNFRCANPARFPFDAPLMRALRASQLLYNWNTTGFGLLTDSSDLSVYATTRTGALPVIYLPEREEGVLARLLGVQADKEMAAKVYKAEDDGYRYYATLNNPLLARAVQYATLYQIFKTFNVSATSASPPRSGNSRTLSRTQHSKCCDLCERPRMRI
jgi:hypothetical protein